MELIGLNVIQHRKTLQPCAALKIHFNLSPSGEEGWRAYKLNPEIERCVTEVFWEWILLASKSNVAIEA